MTMPTNTTKKCALCAGRVKRIAELRDELRRLQGLVDECQAFREEPAREPRRWPVGSPQPTGDGLRVQSTTNHVIFRYNAAWDRWTAEQASGGDGNEYSWHALNSEHASEGGMELVEVLGAVSR